MDLPKDFVPESRYDSIVIGAGPAGSTYATLLAKKGYSVLVLEGSKFPRFAVGEIVAPTGIWRVWTELGLTQEQLDERFVRKWAGGWVAPSGEEFAFEQDVHPEDGACRPFVYSFERSLYDDFLLDHARNCGVTALEEAWVEDVLYDETGRMNGVRFTRHGQTFEVRTPLVVDASGRVNFLARKLGLRLEMHELKSFAVFAHWTGLRRNTGDAEGDVRLIFGKDMWFWWAPLKGDKVSVGVVGNREVYWDEYAKDPEAFYHKYIPTCPYLVERFKDRDAKCITGFRPIGKGTGGAHLNEYHAFSKQLVGNGWALIGDAGGFVDPIFSAGLHLVQSAGSKLAKRVIHAFEGGQELSEEYLKQYQDDYLDEFKVLMGHIQEFATYYFEPKFVNFFIRLGNSRERFRRLYVDTFVAYDPAAIAEYTNLLRTRFRAFKKAGAAELVASGAAKSNGA